MRRNFVEISPFYLKNNFFCRCWIQKQHFWLRQHYPRQQQQFRRISTDISSLWWKSSLIGAQTDSPSTRDSAHLRCFLSRISLCLPLSLRQPGAIEGHSAARMCLCLFFPSCHSTFALGWFFFHFDPSCLSLLQERCCGVMFFIFGSEWSSRIPCCES